MSKKNKQSEAVSAKLTERQAAEKKEAAQIRLYTVLFVAVMVVLIVIAATVAISRSIANSGMREKKTTAVTIGSHSVNNAELNYYYMDAINNFMNTYGSYVSLYGIDTTVPLDKQYVGEEGGETWEDYFVETAVASAKATYALVDAANAAGFVLPADQQTNIDLLSNNLDAYATMYGAESADAYLKNLYGSGASKAGYLDYYTKNVTASAYQESYHGGLTYTDAQIQEADKAAPETYSSYSYNQYYLAVSKFLEGGTTGEDGVTTYSDEEQAAAELAAKVAANQLIGEEVTNAEELDAAIAALDVNADSSASSTVYNKQSYASINSKLSDWITDSARKAGDKTVVVNETTSTDDDGNETTTVSGYYVVLFNGMDDNTVNMVNVRHILVGFEGGTEENGTTVYSDEEKAAAKAAAEELLAQWKAGEATEDSFAALATENTTDTGSAANGGLYEDVYPGQMVTAFNDWCFDSSRQVGDTDIVETNYGYHVMYFVGTSETTYREHLIAEELRDTDFNDWYQGLLDAVTTEMGSTKYLRKDLILGSQQ